MSYSSPLLSALPELGVVPEGRRRSGLGFVIFGHGLGLARWKVGGRVIYIGPCGRTWVTSGV